MELMIRALLPDAPGSLARLAGALGEAGADIQAVEVIEVIDGRALDDLVVAVGGAEHARRVLAALADLPDVEVVRSGPSRGDPADAITRVAVGLEALLTGSSAAEDGIATLVGGILRADRAEIVDDPPRERAHRLVLPCPEGWLVLQRDHDFTDTERQRALALTRTASWAAVAADPSLAGAAPERRLPDAQPGSCG